MDYSIIIPHKNVPDLLQRCLDTIPQMDGLEVIVIDDNSLPENKPAPISQARILLTTEGKGAGYARNRGLEMAKGRWLIFVDADDMLTPEFPDLISRHKDDDADMVIFKADSVNEQTGERATRHIQHNEAVDAGLNGSESPRQAAIGVSGPVCRMVRRELVEKNGLRFEEIMVANDVMFVSRAVCLARKIVFDPGVLYIITERTTSLIHSHQGDKQRYFTRMDVCARANDLYRQHKLRRLPIIRMVWQARRQGIFLQSLAYAIRRRILFSGMSNYLYLIKRKFL